MTLHPQLAPLIPQSPLPLPGASRRPPPAPALFGTLITEVVLRDPGADLQAPGWHFRLWPVARLGDATLEARPLCSGLGSAELRRTLRHLGVTPLGPVHERG